MRRSMLVLALLAIPPGVMAEESATEEYARIRATTPRTADAQAKLALWCEAHGLEAQKARHLALALALEPRHALARGLMGLVEHRGRWLTPAGAAKAQREDAAAAELRAEYVRRRDGAAMTAEGQWKLAEWCRVKGLDAEARAHTENVVRWEPGRDEAWAKLGYKKRDGRWMRPEAIELARVEAEAQQKADKAWMPKLKAWKGALKGARREKALGEMEGVKDPRVVPSILAVFAKGSGDEQRVGVKLLGQVDTVRATHALALFAVFGGDEDARRLAGELLRARDPRESIPPLIGLIRKPYKYEVKPVSGPGGQGKLVVEGEKANLERTYLAPSPLPNVPGMTLGLDPNTGAPAIILPPAYSPSYRWFEPISRREGLASRRRLDTWNEIRSGLAVPAGKVPAWDAIMAQAPAILAANRPPALLSEFDDPRLMGYWNNVWTVMSVPVADYMAEAQRSTRAASRSQDRDIELIKEFNSNVHFMNDQVRVVLRDLTQKDLGDDREAWRSWWSDTILGMPYGLKSQENPTFYENVVGYQPQVQPTITPAARTVDRVYHSCFAAGTSVLALEGPRAIESLVVGDRVLSQDAGTGGLAYKPVVTVFHNPPQQVLRLKVGEGDGVEEILPTQHHRFWVAGKGWVMARHLKSGDAIRTLEGIRRVESIDKGEVQPVFNLEVADTSSYFVGACGALAHDIKLPKAVEHPFDAE